MGNKWSNLITTSVWKVGGGNSNYLYSGTPQSAYNYEVGNNSNDTTYSAKIGLMYVSDYGYAASPDYWTTTMSSYNRAVNSNWMYMGIGEWTISPSGFGGSAFIVHYSGPDVGYSVSSSSYAIRPCFYLNSDVAYSSGSGTSSDPIRIVV